MSTKTTKNPLVLSIGDRQMCFLSSEEFEFALAGRIGLPASRIKALMTTPSEALMKEAGGIRQLEQQIRTTVALSEEDSSAIGQFLGDLDLALISKDNDWRAIIHALYGLDSSSNEFRKVGLVKYSQYLTNRYELVQVLCSSRQGQPGEGPLPTPLATQELKAPVISDAARSSDLGRLPKGETVDITLPTNQSVVVMLAKHQFSIVRDSEFRFIDEAGGVAALRQGKNIVGRDQTSDVVIDAEHRDISRKHLIVETEGSQMIRLTDISSLGTSIPREHLDSTAH